MNPFISVIIPVYNRTQYVGEAIDSVLKQTLDRDKFEIVVVTNVDLPERDGVKIIKSNEKWLGPKIVQGIEEARGEVISLLEDDDLFLPNKLEVMYKIFKEKEKIGLFKNLIKWINANGREWLDPLPQEPIEVTHKDLRLDMLGDLISKYGVGFNNSSMSFRKEHIYKYLNYLNEIKLIVDKFIGFIFLFTSQVVIWNQPLSIYRVLSDSATYKLGNLDHYLEHKRNFQKIVYEDYVTTYKALKNTGFEEFLEKYIYFQKIIVKLLSKNKGEMKVTLKEAFKAVPLHNPKAPRWRILSAYLASFLPYSLKKKLIFEYFYKQELKDLKFI